MDIMERANSIEQKGQTVIHMEVGQPGTSAPEAAKDFLKKAMEDNKEELSDDETKSLTEAIEKVEEACKSDSKEDIDKAVEDLSKVAQPLSDKLFKKEQAQAQENSANEDSKDQTDDAVDAEFKEVDDEKDK